MGLEIWKNENQISVVQQLTIGLLFCMSCVVFLGLKFKFFRAQLNFSNISKKKKETETVQGIGYKVNSNSEMPELYKVTSEFSDPATVFPKSQHQKEVKNTISNFSKSNRSLKSNANANGTAPMSKELKFVTRTQAHSEKAVNLKNVQEQTTESFNKPDNYENNYTFTKKTVAFNDQVLQHNAVGHKHEYINRESEENTYFENEFIFEKTKNNIKFDTYNEISPNTKSESSLYSNFATSIFFGSESNESPSSTVTTNSKDYTANSSSAC